MLTQTPYVYRVRFGIRLPLLANAAILVFYTPNREALDVINEAVTVLKGLLPAKLVSRVVFDVSGEF